MGFILFGAGLFLGVHIFLHALLYFFFAGAPGKVVWLALALNILSAVAVGIGFSPNYSKAITGPVIQVASIWLVTEVLMIVMLLAANIVRFIYQHVTANPTFFTTGHTAVITAVFLCISLGLCLYGSLVERKANHVIYYDMPIADLGPKLEGYKIAQLSDIHLGPYFDLDDLDALLAQTAAEKPDVLVITGDLFDDASTMIQAAKVVDSYKDQFPQGIFYCRGNHEYFRGIPLLEIALGATDIHNLVNKNELVVDDTRPLYIAGADYPIERDQFDSLMEIYTDKSLKNIPENAVTVLLAHHPDFLRAAAKHDVDLVLSGHTHGGQIGLFGKALVPPVFEYIRGWYKLNNTALYVHVGNGSWFPLRLGCAPEIAIFKLTSK